MRHPRCENQQVPGSEVVVPSFRLDQEASFEDVDRHVPSCQMPVQAPAGLEGEEDVPDRRMMEEGDLAVAVL